ncbi:protein ELF4-LIKE 3-like [Primulina eburnea]|uniref:protein ELF4-LIKE 3-like n=1 Tax=Primulina eburnea TaxID=1245227 RepID=UPI003C6C2B21
MEGGAFSSEHGEMLQTFQKSIVQVQNILDQNKLLINEISQNQESKIPDDLSRNARLIRELNDNVRRVVDLYSHLSNNLTRTTEINSVDQGESNGRAAGNNLLNSETDMKDYLEKVKARGFL